jgi:hypothetical protein
MVNVNVSTEDLSEHVEKVANVDGTPHGNFLFENVASKYFAVRYSKLCENFVKKFKQLKREELTKVVKFYGT